MKNFLLIVLLLTAVLSNGAGLTGADKEATVYPIAVLPFEERGANVKELGAQVSDVLFAELVGNGNLMLVDRAELSKTISEQSLSVTGVVKPEEAVQVGQMTGAKLLVSGSVLQVDKQLYLVAKIIGTETTRVAGTSVNGKASDELGPLVKKLAGQIAITIAEQAPTLVAKQVSQRDRIEHLRQQIGDRKLPIVRVEISERHVGQVTIDPAAQTEIALMCHALGFEVIDNQEAAVGAADVLISGEGFSETAGRIGGLISVKARVEIKAVDRITGKVIVADRQTTRVVDATEQIAGKTALQEAALVLADRILPKVAQSAKR